jgi:hypothetical protein
MPCPSHPPGLDYSDYVWRGVQVMKLLIMQFLPISRHFISLYSKYSNIEYNMSYFSGTVKFVFRLIQITHAAVRITLL